MSLSNINEFLQYDMILKILNFHKKYLERWRSCFPTFIPVILNNGSAIAFAKTSAQTCLFVSMDLCMFFRLLFIFWRRKKAKSVLLISNWYVPLSGITEKQLNSSIHYRLIAQLSLNCVSMSVSLLLARPTFECHPTKWKWSTHAYKIYRKLSH